eukprot:CAMPEP_0173420740 /NCGR_PEP_ID=MMETSP1357-20121228/2100_1 /TAXON_ID=77926 /ORGANISM="Hemiselmis rufescens, Strain PCC563" /LENGTH=72 /DNA_ID=CAMNT_0014383559 /DNA_START=67 /DNA_END=282 /DNA_ORIENTATION=-
MPLSSTTGLPKSSPSPNPSKVAALTSPAYSLANSMLSRAGMLDARRTGNLSRHIVAVSSCLPHAIEPVTEIA